MQQVMLIRRNKEHTMQVMAKRKSTSEPKKSPRKGESISLWLDSELIAALDLFISQSRPRVTKRSTVEAALQDFLSREGFWPVTKAP